MKYLSNLADLEFDGKRYGHGDEVKVSEDNRGAADVLVKRGDLTLVADGDQKSTSNGEPTEAPSDPLDHDEDGRKGGSKSGEQATARKARG
jgi:hypothetical protein